MRYFSAALLAVAAAACRAEAPPTDPLRPGASEHEARLALGQPRITRFSQFQPETTMVFERVDCVGNERRIRVTFVGGRLTDVEASISLFAERPGWLDEVMGIFSPRER
jgi:hypothetical protein